MHDEIGLLVDKPRAGGSGMSNTDNTARKAFKNESKFAEILGIDPELIHGIHLMLIAVNADILLDLNSFREYGRQTAEFRVNKYLHFCMPVSLHQLFILSWEAIPYSPLPDSFFMEQSRKREQNSQSLPASPLRLAKATEYVWGPAFSASMYCFTSLEITLEVSGPTES